MNPRSTIPPLSLPSCTVRSSIPSSLADYSSERTAAATACIVTNAEVAPPRFHFLFLDPAGCLLLFFALLNGFFEPVAALTVVDVDRGGSTSKLASSGGGVIADALSNDDRDIGDGGTTTVGRDNVGRLDADRDVTWRGIRTDEDAGIRSRSTDNSGFDET